MVRYFLLANGISTTSVLMVLFGPYTIANTTTNQDELRQSHVIISWIQSKICMKLEREQDPRDAVSSFRKNFHLWLWGLENGRHLDWRNMMNWEY